MRLTLLRTTVSWLCGAALLLELTAPRLAQASPLFELVGSGRNGGFNSRVMAVGPAASYFNPSLLPHAPGGLELGTFFLSDKIDINLNDRSSHPSCNAGQCDVPLVLGTGPESFRHGDGSRLSSPTVPTLWLNEGRPQQSLNLNPNPRQSAGSGDNDRLYQVVGLVNPMFKGRVAIGLYAMIPLSEFTTAKAFYNDEREQFFSNSLHPELYSDRLTATSLAFGVGGKVNDKLSVGLSFTLALKNTAQAPVYISDLGDLNTLLLDSDIGVEAAVAPHFGVTYDPSDKLRIVATVHTPQAFEIETGFDYFLATGSKQGASVSFTHSYMPLTGGLGTHYEIGEFGGHNIGIAATAVFARWSQYKDRHSERPHPDYEWSDTLAGSVGVRHARGPLQSYLDATYQPSPVPAQTGRSNYVDNNRLGVTGGFDYAVSFWGSKLRIGLSAQGHRLFNRKTVKFDTPINPQPNPNLPGFGDNHFPQLVIDEVPDDAVDGLLGDAIPNRDGLQTNNPGWPGYSSNGWIYGVSLNISVLY